MSITVTPQLLSYGLVFLIVGALVSLYKYRIPGTKGRYALYCSLYMNRYAMALEYYGLRGKEIKSHVNSLRADLAVLENDQLSTALKGLGPPRTLAADTAVYRRRPSWLRGMLWFLLSHVLILTLVAMMNNVYIQAIENTTSTDHSGQWALLGILSEITMDPGLLVKISGYPLIGVPIVMFLIGSRIWRLMPASRTRQTASDLAKR